MTDPDLADELHAATWTDVEQTATVELELPVKLAQKVDAWQRSAGAGGLARQLEAYLVESGEPMPRACPECRVPMAFATARSEDHWCPECCEYYSAADALDQADLLNAGSE